MLKVLAYVHTPKKENEEEIRGRGKRRRMNKRKKHLGRDE